MSNKIVTSVSALTDDNVDNISDNNVVCIDIEQGRIGVHTSNPTCEIDVSGAINCNVLRINNVPLNPTGTVDFENMETSLIPLDTNTYTIGSANKLWSTAHINEAKINKLTVLSSTNRLYQEIKGDISWNAVNGYYGLAKNAYPALDPISYGGRAVSNWTPVSLPESCYGICWSPELRIFVVVAYTNFLNNTNQVMTSRDGINWNIHSTSIEENNWRGVCWSPELKIFVAVGEGSDGIMTSTNGINWQALGDSLSALSVCWSPELGLFVAIGEGNVIISPDGSNWTSIQIPAIEYNSVCWSPELGIFVAVGIDRTGNNNGVITSSDGITWTSRTTPGAGCNNVCWSSELGIFVAVASVTYDINSINFIKYNTIMTSSNGINWTIATTGYPSLTGVCWCPQLRIFVAVGPSGVMTSANGTTWFVDILAFANNGPSYADIGSTNISWSPELGIFVAPANGKVMRSSLKGRPPTSYNVFDSSFNSIDEQGMWTFSNVTIRDSITFPSNSISSSNIADLNVTEGKIGALAVTEGKIGASAVTDAKIATGTITEAKLASALQTKLNAKANLAGPTTFTGAIVLPSTTTIGNVSSTELGYIDGVTSSIQNQLSNLSNNKAPSASPSFSGTITIPSGANILSANVSVTSEQLAFVNGATSNIQNQLTNLSNNKAPSANPTFTGTVVLPASTINSSHIQDGSILGSDISAGTITDTNIAVGTITELKLASGVQTKLNAVVTIANGSITAAKLESAFLNRIYNLEYPGFYGSLRIQNSNTSGYGASITFTLNSQNITGNIQLLGSTTLAVNQEIDVPILIQNRLLNKDTSFNIVYSTTSRTITSTIPSGISVITPIVIPNIYFSVLPAFIHNGTIQLTIVLPIPPWWSGYLTFNRAAGSGTQYISLRTEAGTLANAEQYTGTNSYFVTLQNQENWVEVSLFSSDEWNSFSYNFSNIDASRVYSDLIDYKTWYRYNIPSEQGNLTFSFTSYDNSG